MGKKEEGVVKEDRQGWGGGEGEGEGAGAGGVESPSSSFSLKPISQSLVSNKRLINKLHDLACSGYGVAFTLWHTKNTNSYLEEDSKKKKNNFLITDRMGFSLFLIYSTWIPFEHGLHEKLFSPIHNRQPSSF